MNKEFYIKLQAKIDDSSKTINKLNKQIKTMENKISSLEIKVKMPSSANKGFGDLNTQLNKLKIDMSEFQNNMLSTSNTFDTTTTRYTNNAGKILTIQEKMIAGEKKYKLSLKEIGNAVETNAKQADKWQYSWSKAFQSFTTYMSVTTVFYQIINTMKDMVNEVTELDSALVELRKVTDLEGEALDNFVIKAYNASEAVAKTGTEMIQAATEFAKAGYNEEDILKLGELALMYTNIADEQVGAADSAEFIIAQMKAFNIEATEAIHIIDAVNEVANKFAVSSADIANNLGKSSAVMANAGNSYEQMIGLLTAGTEITRNASKVSNGLKTITLRLQGMNDEGEKDLDLVASMEKMFNKLNLSVYKTDGSLKNTFEILQDLAPVYQKATAAEKAYITETIAGKYQAQNAAAILNNFETAISATETAFLSAGSAAQENAVYIDSINGRINQFNSEFEKLASGTISDDFIKRVISLGTAMLKLVNSLGGLKGILPAVIALLAVFNTQLVVTAGASVVGALAKGFTLLVSGFKSIIYVIPNAIAAFKAYNAGIITTATLMQTLVPIIGLVTLAITGVVLAANSAQQATEEAMDSAVESGRNLQELNNSLDSSIDKINEYNRVLNDSASTESQIASSKQSLIAIQDSLIERFGKEAEGIDLVNGSIEEQIEKIRELQKEEAEAWLRENQAGIEGAEKSKNKKNSESITLWGADSWDGSYLLGDLADSYGIDNSLIGTFGVGSIKLKGTDEEILNYLNYASDYILKNKDALMEAYDMSEEGIQDVLNDLGTHITTYAEKVGDAEKILQQKAINEMIKNGTYYESLDKLEEEGAKGTLNLTKAAEILGTDGVENFEKAGFSLEDLVDKYNDTSKAYDAAFNNVDNTAFLDGAKELIYSNNLTSESVQELLDKHPSIKKYFEDFGMNAADVAGYLREFRVTIDDISNSVYEFGNNVTSIESAYSTLSGAVEEFNTNGSLSADTLKTLATEMVTLADGTQASLLSFLEFTENGLKFNSAALQENVDLLREKAIADVQESAAQQILQIVYEATKTSADNAAKGTEDNKNKLEESLQADADKIKSNITLAASYETVKAAANGKGIDTSNWDKVQDKIDGVITNAQSSISALMHTSVNIRKTSGAAKSSSSSKKSEKEWWETELEKLQNQFKYNEITIEEYIRGLDKLLGKVKKGTDAWRKINEELQKQRLTKVEDDYKRGTISLDEYIKKLKELIKAYKKGSDAWNDLADKIKKALQDKADRQKDDLATAEDAAVGIIDEEIDKLNKLKEEQEDYYDKLIDDKKAANDETEKELELARLQEALANAQKEKTKRVWREGIGKKSADIKDNYIGQMLEIVKTEVRLNLRWCVYG